MRRSDKDGPVKPLMQRLKGYQAAFAVLILIACIQGGVIISQFLTAFYMSSSDVGVIRAVESIFSLFLLGVSVGAPSLAVREAAAVTDTSQRSQLLVRLLWMELITGTLAAVVFLLLSHSLLHSPIIRYAAAIAGVALLSNSVRVMTGFVQGTQSAATVSAPVIVGTLGSVVAVTLATHMFGIDGWVLGRYLGEALVLIALIVCLRRYFRGHSLFMRASFPSWHLVSLGVAANVALFVRLLCDNLPILGMTAAKVSTDQIGYFGLATLMLMAPTMIFSVLMQVELPRIVTVCHDLPAVAGRMRRLMTSSVKLAMLFVAMGIAFGAINHFFVRISYTKTLDLLMLMVIALPLRVLALSVGTVFMALQRYRLSVYVNLVEATLTVVPAYFLTREFGALGAAMVFVLGAVISVVLHIGTLQLTGLLGSSLNWRFESRK